MVTWGSLWRLSWRSAWRNPRRTGIVVTAVAVGIAGCLISMAFNFGMVAQMVDTAIANELGHVQIHAPGYDRDPRVEVRLASGGSAGVAALEAQPSLRVWSTRVRGQGLVNSPRASVGVSVLGVDPLLEPEVSRLAASISQGTWLSDPRRVLMGERMAARLRVDLGDKVVLSVQDVSGDLTGQAYRIGGLFRSASLELDQSTVVLVLAEAQALFGLGDDVSEIVALARDDRQIEALRDGAAEVLGPSAEVRSWKEREPLLVYMVDMFDSMSTIIYAAVFIAMAFGIANVLLMAVYERTREIAMMRAMGMRGSFVIRLIVAESLFVTLMGLLLGNAIAIGVVLALPDGIDLSAYAEGLGSFGIGTRVLPVLRRSDFTVPLAVAIVAAVLASLWPAIRATRLRPAEGLRKL